MNINVTLRSRKKLIAQIPYDSLEISPRRTEDFNIDVPAVVRRNVYGAETTSRRDFDRTRIE